MATQYSNEEKTLDRSAFDEPIVTSNKSVLKSVFRDVIPDTTFKLATKINGVVTIYETIESASAYCKAVNGELVLTAPPNLGDITILYSRRHPQFHSNRGKKYSNSMFYDHKTTGDCEIGFANVDDTDLSIKDGITFQRLVGVSYANIYSIGVQKYHTVIPELVLSTLDLDYALGHLFDIQAQLRDVGDIFWFLSSKTLGRPKMVHKFNGLNNQSNITVSTSAMHAVYIARNNGVQSQLRSGCIDVSNETVDEDKQYPFVFSNSADVTGVGSAPGSVLLLIWVPFIYKSALNTRDSIHIKCSVTSDKRAKVYLYRLSNTSRITKGAGLPLALTDWSTKPGTSLQYIDNSIDLPGQLGVRITGFNLTGLDPFDGTGIPAGTTEQLVWPAIKEAPIDLVHGECFVAYGIGSPAAAAMAVESWVVAEGI